MVGRLKFSLKKQRLRILMDYLIPKHAVVNFPFTNDFYDSVKIIVAGPNQKTWGFA